MTCSVGSPIHYRTGAEHAPRRRQLDGSGGSNELAMTHVDGFLVQGIIICSGVSARRIADLSYAERL